MRNLVLLIAITFFPFFVESQQNVPGTKVTLVPPEGFVLSKNFPGFVDEKEKASIMINELPGPYAEVAKGFTATGLASKGMQLISKEDIKIGMAEALLLNVSQSSNGQNFRKWIVITGDGSDTVIALATFMEASKQPLSNLLKDSLLSLQWNKGAKVSPEAGLTFDLLEAGELKKARIVGNMILFTLNGAFPTKSLDDPMVVVGSSASENMEIIDLATFARRRLQQTDSLKDIHVLSEESFSADSLDGCKIIAEALDKDTSKKRFVLQGLLMDSHGYFLFQGFAPFDEKEQYQAVFETMLKSFKRK